MKRLYYLFMVALIAAFSASCKDEYHEIDSIPVLEVEDPTDMSRTSVTLNGSIRTGHPEEIIAYGFLFGSTSDFSGDDTQTIPAYDESLYHISAEVKDLTYGATYYYAVYVNNGFERIVSDTKAFTMDRASAILSDFQQVDNTRSRFSAHISDDGGGEIKRVGFCWSEEKNPTIYEGEFLVAELDSKQTFTLSLPLEPTKTYYVRAFVQSQITEEESLTEAYSEEICIVPGPADNEIWYTSTDGKVVTPYESGFDANVVSNTYENGRGVIEFDKPVSKIETATFAKYEDNRCGFLSSVTFSDAIEIIETGAFYGCENLEAFYGKYTSEDNRCIIKDGELIAFAPAGLREYTIPDDVKIIGEDAFWMCGYLESIVIPNSVSTISAYAFSECQLLENLSIPDSVVKIDEYAFSSCNSLEEVSIGNGVAYIGEGAFYECEELKKVTIPESVTFIGNGAFMACIELKNVYCYPIVPPEIDSSAFTGNPDDRKIFVPTESLDAYKSDSEWNWLANAIFPMEESMGLQTIRYTSTDGKIVEPYKLNVFGANIVSNTYKNGVGEIVFDAPVAKIGPLAFLGIENLRSIIIPNDVTMIEEQAFSQCLYLEKITIPSSVKSIGKAAFYECKNLQNISIPEGVVSLGEESFMDCVNLKSINLPNSLTMMDRYLFGGCISLENVNIPDSVTKIGEMAFYGCTNLLTVTLGRGMDRIENGLFIDCENLGNVVIPLGITTIGQMVFVNCSNLTAVKIPNSVTTIEEYAFSFCPGLKEITIPDSVVSIGEAAFSQCANLKNCTIGKGVNEIGLYIFSYTGLEELSIPNHIISINDGAFNECLELQKVVIGDAVEFIGKGAFYGCAKLEELIIGNSVNTISQNAFYGCDALENLIVPGSVKEIGTQAFWNCPSLKNLTIEEGVETIGDAAFAECTSLTSVTIPESVTTIGGGVFHTASSLSEVICKPIVPPVSGGVNMFKNNSSGRIIYVPEESVDAYKTASYWSDYAADIYSMNERIDPTPAISFEFAVDVTESSFSATVTPSADAYYIGEAFEKSDYDAKIAQYGTIDAYMKEYITTEFSWMSLVEAMELLAENNLFVHKGTWNAGYSQLPADTEFVIVAYLVDMTTCDALSEIETHEFKTLPASQPDPEQLFEFVVDVTESAFSATVTPTSDAYYIGEAFYKSDYEALVAQYGTIDAYMKEYIVENFSWMSLAESMALLAENDLLVHQGTWNVGYNNLPAGTAFVLVAYQVDMTTCNALSNVEIYEFSTSASTPMLIRRMNRVSQPKSTSSAMLSANQLKILIGRF